MKLELGTLLDILTSSPVCLDYCCLCRFESLIQLFRRMRRGRGKERRRRDLQGPHLKADLWRSLALNIIHIMSEMQLSRSLDVLSAMLCQFQSSFIPHTLPSKSDRFRNRSSAHFLDRLDCFCLFSVPSPSLTHPLALKVKISFVLQIVYIRYQFKGAASRR